MYLSPETTEQMFKALERLAYASDCNSPPWKNEVINNAFQVMIKAREESKLHDTSFNWEVK